MGGPGRRRQAFQARSYERCRHCVETLLNASRPPGRLSRALLRTALDNFDWMDRNHPQRARLAAGLLQAMRAEDVVDDPAYAKRMVGLLNVIGADERLRPPDWAALRVGAINARINRRGAGAEDLAWAQAEVARYPELAEADPAVALRLRYLHAATRAAGATGSADVSGTRLLMDDFRDIARAAEALPDPDTAARLAGAARFMACVVGMADAHRRNDPAALAEAVRAARAVLASEGSWTAELGDVVPAALDGMGLLAQYEADDRDDQAKAELRETLGETAERVRALQQDAPYGMRVHATEEKMARAAYLSHTAPDGGGDEAVGLLAAAARSGLGADGIGSSPAVFAGEALIERYRTGGRRRDLRRGIKLLEQALRTHANRPYVDWTRITRPLSFGYAATGRFARAGSVAAAGLRGNAWNALLQSDPADMQVSIRDAAADAITVARMQLEFGDAEAAVAALETGRGLILFSARQAERVRESLDSLGEVELAEQWTQAVDRLGVERVPAELRLRAIGTLAGVRLDEWGRPVAGVLASGSPLLAPPTMEAVRAALTARGFDALVYLVPADPPDPGFALLVPAAGAVRLVPLPDLDPGRSASFEEHVLRLSRAARGGAYPAPADHHAAAAERDLPASAPGTEAITRGDAVEEVCDWAWEAAVRSVLEAAPETPAGRPPRLILVPMRELALVPWHAARREHAGRLRYALEDAVFSYTASARMICDAAQSAAHPVALGPRGLIVGDPHTAGQFSDLPSARLEAASIHAAFYPQARLIGRLPGGGTGPDGAGTARQVADWLADPSGGEMLHLACHGAVREAAGRDATSFLCLADGERLSAEDVVRGLGSARGHRIALAVLAACSTAKSGRGYDEAFNLGTALLARGVRSVISAQWPVPDEETSVLMFMLHHHLRVEGLGPADALRAAQLWLLHDRRPPATMPEQLRERLRASPERENGPAPVVWAGFVHAGW